MRKHYQGKYHFSYYASFHHHLLAILIVFSLLCSGLYLAFHNLVPIRFEEYRSISWVDIALATLSTFARLSLAYLLSLVVAIPLVFLTAGHRVLEKIFLPVFDILQSMPVLAFFPIVVLLFIKFQLFEEATIFILFMAMVWSLVFSMIAGLKTIPRDIQYASIIFGAKGLKKILSIYLPAIFPYIVTGSLLAWGAGWNVIIVAEVLHSYIPNGNSSQDLFGLGSLLVNSALYNNSLLFLVTLLTIVVLITLLNFLVWQRLLKLAERYKFE